MLGMIAATENEIMTLLDIMVHDAIITPLVFSHHKQHTRGIVHAILLHHLVFPFLRISHCTFVHSNTCIIIVIIIIPDIHHRADDDSPMT